MHKIIGVAVIILIALAGYLFFRSEQNPPVKSTGSPISKDAGNTPNGSVKEFATTAYYDETGVWYSLKEMRVQKGDTVRVKATNTKGMHDFTIDEFGVQKELPMNEEVLIEFIADKSGEFVFYCSKPGHRAKGQWGTLIVE